VPSDTRSAHPLTQLQEQMTNLFEQVVNRLPTLWENDLGSLRLWEFNLSETEDEMIVRAELPGFEAHDLDVQLDGNTLIIRAERTQASNDGTRRGDAWTSRSFRRTLTLPQPADPQRVQATYRNGVLELHLPKRAEAKGKRIDIQGPGGSAGPSPSERPIPGTTPAGSSYTAGASYGGLHAGGLSAAEVVGGGIGSDMDNPDITGRGSTADLARRDRAWTDR